MKPSLIVLAAGMGSRYGSLKQLDGVGPHEETIIDYAVFDAIKAGYGKVIFIIRESFSEDFKAKISSKFEDQIEVEFAFQAVDSPIKGINKFPERSKPWGTAHAVLVAKDLVKEPFAVVNADDFYGRDALRILAEFLTTKVSVNHFAMVGYELAKTLSDNGSVSRGICEMNSDGNLTTVVERTKIERLEDQRIYFSENAGKIELEAKNLVSMNLWGFHPSIFQAMENQFVDFVNNNANDPKSEFYIPLVVNDLISKEKATVEVLPTSSQWYGVTYKEDKPLVQKALIKMTGEGTYPEDLWK